MQTPVIIISGHLDNNNLLSIKINNTFSD